MNKVVLTEDETAKFIQWVQENIWGDIIPSDEGNEDAFRYNLIHAIGGDNKKYAHLDEQDEEISGYSSQWRFIPYQGYYPSIIIGGE